MADVPVNLPSQALLTRPDVLVAEHTLKADYANIGAARAAFFPSITLTAAKGVQSDQLSLLFGGNNNAWSFAPSINLPSSTRAATAPTSIAPKPTEISR